MSKFNKIEENNKMLNHEGEIAYKISEYEELIRLIIINFVSDTFYTKEDNSINRIQELVQMFVEKDEIEFLFGLALSARLEYNMRSSSHILVGEIIKNMNGEKYYLSDFIYDVIERVDDMTEILSYLLPEGKNNKKSRKGVLKHALVKGLRDILGTKKQLGKFNEYQLAKYNKKGKIKLIDIVRLSHSSSELSEKIRKNKLQTPYTWEVMISSISKNNYLEKDGKIKKEFYDLRFDIWNNLLSTNKLGIMALIKNLRNILNDTINSSYSDGAKDELINKIVNILLDKNTIQNSKLLPFRFLSAYKEIKLLDSNIYSSKILNALKVSGNYSVNNISLEGTLGIFCDVSGSMQYPISKNSTIELIDIGLLFGGMSKLINNKSITGIFGNYVKFKQNTGDSIFELVDSYTEGEVGYGTNGYLIFDELINKNIKLDKIFIFTDTNLYVSGNDGIEISFEKSLSKYIKNINKDVKVFIFNLSSASNFNISLNQNIYTISGWSDKVFSYFDLLQNIKNGKLISYFREIGMKYTKY